MAKKNTQNENIVISGRIYKNKKSIFTMDRSPVHVSDGMSGKMLGIPAVSTSPLVNPICQARRLDKESVCSHCFSCNGCAYKKELRECLATNYYLLNESVLPGHYLPKFGNVQIVRIESFGDVASVVHAMNYINMIKKNPSVQFGWWTKNTKFVDAAINELGKPDNMMLIESSPKLNVRVMPCSPNVDKTFTVYTKEYIAENNLENTGFINCGAKSCLGCRICYLDKDITDVRELLK